MRSHKFRIRIFEVLLFDFYIKKVLIHFFNHQRSQLPLSNHYIIRVCNIGACQDLVDVSVFTFTMMVELFLTSVYMYFISDYLQKYLLLAVHKESSRLHKRPKTVNIGGNDEFVQLSCVSISLFPRGMMMVVGIKPSC